MQEAYNGLMKAVKDGRISKERLDESVKRILLMKMSKSLILRKEFYYLGVLFMEGESELTLKGELCYIQRTEWVRATLCRLKGRPILLWRGSSLSL